MASWSPIRRSPAACLSSCRVSRASSTSSSARASTGARPEPAAARAAARPHAATAATADRTPTSAPPAAPSSARATTGTTSAGLRRCAGSSIDWSTSTASTGSPSSAAVANHRSPPAARLGLRCQRPRRAQRPAPRRRHHGRPRPGRHADRRAQDQRLEPDVGIVDDDRARRHDVGLRRRRFDRRPPAAAHRRRQHHHRPPGPRSGLAAGRKRDRGVSVEWPVGRPPDHRAPLDRAGERGRVRVGPGEHRRHQPACRQDRRHLGRDPGSGQGDRRGRVRRRGASRPAHASSPPSPSSGTR